MMFFVTQRLRKTVANWDIMATMVWFMRIIPMIVDRMSNMYRSERASKEVRSEVDTIQLISGYPFGPYQLHEWIGSANFYQELARFIRSLPAKSRMHIWAYSIKCIQADGYPQVLSVADNKELIHRLLCNLAIVRIKV